MGFEFSHSLGGGGQKTLRSVLLVLNQRNPLKLGVGSGTVKGRRLLLLFDFYCAWLNVLDVLDHRECVPMQHRAVESVCVSPANTGCLFPIQMASTLTWHLSHFKKKSETECAPWVSRRKPESPPRTFRAWFFPRFSIFILLPKIRSRIRRQSPGEEVMDGMVWEITLHDPPQTVSKGYIKKKKSNLIFWITTPWAFVIRELGLALFTPYGWKVTDSRDKPFSADIGCFIFSFSFIFCNRQGSFQTPRREMGHRQVCISLPVLV